MLIERVRLPKDVSCLYSNLELTQYVSWNDDGFTIVIYRIPGSSPHFVFDLWVSGRYDTCDKLLGSVRRVVDRVTGISATQENYTFVIGYVPAVLLNHKQICLTPGSTCLLPKTRTLNGHVLFGGWADDLFT